MAAYDGFSSEQRCVSKVGRGCKRNRNIVPIVTRASAASALEFQCCTECLCPSHDGRRLSGGRRGGALTISAAFFGAFRFSARAENSRDFDEGTLMESAATLHRR